MAGGMVAMMVVACILTACAQAYPIPRAPEGDPIQAARELSDAPDPVRDGDAAGSCGEFVLDQGQSVPASAVECLSAAASANDSGELAWTFPTVGGDPIVHFAFVDGAGEVTLYVTNAFDSYGGDPGWTTTSCADVVAAAARPSARPSGGCP